MPRRICRRQPPAVGILMLLFFFLALYQMHVANRRGIAQEGVVSSLLSDSKVNLAVLPKEYDETSVQPQHCADVFGRNYLDYFKRTRADYCDTESKSHLTCFHNNVDPENDRTDTLCIVGPAAFIAPLRRFDVHCNPREISGKEAKFGIPTMEEFARYEYKTGSGYILDRFVDYSNDDDLPDKYGSAPTAILVKRHPNTNSWYSLLDLMSMYLTLDVLRIAINPETSLPYFSHSDYHSTQLVILDDLEEGPYIWLWSLFARNPVLRLSNLTETTSLPIFKNVITPLPGLSNPLQQIDEGVTDCNSSQLIHAFTNRILTAYSIPIQSPNSLPNSPSSNQKSKPITLVFITRNETSQDRSPHTATTRKLVNEMALLNSLRYAYDPSILTIKSITYNSLSLFDQLNTTHSDTDILVGVHSSDLTQTMFLRPGSALVELTPFNLRPRSERYHNLANLMEDVEFHRVVTEDNDNATDASGDWEMDDVWISTGRWLAGMKKVVDRMVEVRGLVVPPASQGD